MEAWSSVTKCTAAAHRWNQLVDCPKHISDPIDLKDKRSLSARSNHRQTIVTFVPTFVSVATSSQTFASTPCRPKLASKEPVHRTPVKEAARRARVGWATIFIRLLAAIADVVFAKIL